MIAFVAWAAWILWRAVRAAAAAEAAMGRAEVGFWLRRTEPPTPVHTRRRLLRRL